MARRSGNKEAVLYDALKNVAVASEQNLNDDQLMEKIAKVKDVVPTRSKHDIILVLQYYEFDETAAISAFTEDGAAKALNDWNYTGNNKSKMNTRNKKKNKKKNKKDSTSRESLQSTESLVNKEESSTGLQAEVNVSLDQNQENHFDEERKSICDAEEINDVGVDSCPENTIVSTPTEEKVDLDVANTRSTELHQLNEERKDEMSEANVLQSSSKSDCSRSTSQQRIPSVTSSSSSNTSYSSRFPARSQGRRGLEKSLKDLSRQTAALQRVHTVLEDELQDSDRRIKAAFQEIQRILEERRLELVQEMEKVRRDSRQLIAQRQELAVELKKRAERASSLAESDQDELRADIKQFVVERKYDDELSRTARFVWDRDKICEELRSIGEVVHVKNSYSQRRYSVSSVASSTNPEPAEQPAITNNSSLICNLDKPEETTEGSEANGGTSSQSSVQERHSAGYPRQESRPRIFSNRGRWSPAYRNSQNNFNGKYLHRGRGGRGRGGWQDNYHHAGPPQYTTNIRDRPPNNHRRTDGNFDNSRGAPAYMHRSPRRDWHRQWNNYPSKSGQESNPKDSEVDRGGSGEGQFNKTESKENVSNIVNGFVEH